MNELIVLGIAALIVADLAVLVALRARRRARLHAAVVADDEYRPDVAYLAQLIGQRDTARARLGGLEQRVTDLTKRQDDARALCARFVDQPGQHVHAWDLARDVVTVLDGAELLCTTKQEGQS